MKTKRLALKLLSTLLCLTLIICAVPITAFAATGVAINETNFPDESFRSYVSTNLDKDGNGTLSESEISAVTGINVQNCGISNLKGIEYFTAIKYLNCSENQLTSLDVSNNTLLTELSCSANQLSSLDLSNNTALNSLHCNWNKIAWLDLSNNPLLTFLSCADNYLISLDLSNNSALEKLGCDFNPLITLYLSDNTALKYLSCSYTQLTSLDLSNYTELRSLDCSYNQLTTLDVSKNTKLYSLICSGNQLSSLDLSKNTALERTECEYNYYNVTASANNRFNLSTLPGSFDVSRADNWKGGTVSGNILTVNEGAKAVTYEYDLGNSKKEVFTLTITKASQPEIGDVDLDGVLSIDDATEIQKYIVEIISLDDTQKQLADVNGDSSIDIADATAIQKLIAG